jgi:hypothetical protein
MAKGGRGSPPEQIVRARPILSTLHLADVVLRAVHRTGLPFSSHIPRRANRRDPHDHEHDD